MFAVVVLPEQIRAFALLFDSIPVHPMGLAGRSPHDKSLAMDDFKVPQIGSEASR